jgi:hypothetical protein
MRTVPGGHVDMMSKPSVSSIADTLAVYLDRGSIPKEGTTCGQSRAKLSN